MIFVFLQHLLSLLFDVIIVTGQSDRDKDLEILLLRHQLRILQRKQFHPPRMSRWDTLILLVLARNLTTMTNGARSQLSHFVCLFKPETLLKWHRELVRRNWTLSKRTTPRRPSVRSELAALLLRLAKENPAWGYGKLEGEAGARWAKLGYGSGLSTVRDILKQNKVPNFRRPRCSQPCGMTSRSGQMVAARLVQRSVPLPARSRLPGICSVS